MDTKPSEVTYNYFLTAGETDAQGRMPMWLIVTRVIEVATNHANILGVGYDALKEHGIGWVLTRLSVEMERYPGINESYSVTTWIEGFNRLYSDRCFLIADANGNAIGHIRSMWVAIDMHKRTAADLSVIDRSSFTLSERRCPVQSPGKLRPIADDAHNERYTFRFCDIDFNRHVNTVQYVRHILNQWPMNRYDNYEIERFDIQFHNECLYGQSVDIRHIDNTDNTSFCEIVDDNGNHAVRSAFRWRKL